MDKPVQQAPLLRKGATLGKLASTHGKHRDKEELHHPNYDPLNSELPPTSEPRIIVEARARYPPCHLGMVTSQGIAPGVGELRRAPALRHTLWARVTACHVFRDLISPEITLPHPQHQQSPCAPPYMTGQTTAVPHRVDRAQHRQPS